MFWGGRSVKFWSFSGPGDARWGFGLPGIDFRKGTLGAPFWDGFGILVGFVFEVLFWKASGPRF